MRPFDFMKPFVLLLSIISFSASVFAISPRNFPEKDSLLKRYESLYLTNQSTKLINNGDTKSAATLLLKALPEDLDNPNRPLLKEPLHKLYDIYYNHDIREEILSDSFKGHSSAFTPDNKFVITLSGNRVHLWESASGINFATINCKATIVSADISPSGGIIYFAHLNGEISKLDFATGNMVPLPFKHRSTIHFIKVSPDGKQIVTVGDGVAQVWNLDSGTPAGDVILDVIRADFSPKGDKLLLVTTKSKVNEIDLATWERRNLANIPKAAIAVYSKCGNYIANVPFTGSLAIDIYDAEGANYLERRLVKEGIVNVSFSEDGQKIYVHTKSKLRTVGGVPEFVRMTHSGQLLDVKISKDNRYIATASFDHFARIWDASTGKLVVPPLRHKEKHVSLVNFSPCGNWLISVGRDSDKINVWDVKTGRKLPMEFSVPGEKITAAEFSPCGKYLITGTHMLTAYIWDFKEGKLAFPEMAHTSSVSAVKFSNDGKNVLTAARAGQVRIWDIAGWKGEPRVRVSSLIRHNAAVSGAIFSPDSKLTLSYSTDSTAKVMDVLSGKQLGKDMKHKGRIFGGVFSSNSRMVATYSNDSTVVVWDARSGKPVMGPLKHKWYTGGAAFLDNDKYLAVACWDGNVYVYDISTGEQVLPAMKHKKRVQHLEVSPNGKFLVSGSLDLTTKVWRFISPDSLLKNSSAAVSPIEEPAKELFISASGDTDLAKSHWIASEAEIYLKKKDTLEAAFLLLDGLPVNVDIPEKSYADETMQLLVDIYNSSYGKMQELDYSNVSTVQYSPDGKLLSVGTTDGYLYILDSDTRSLVQVFKLTGKVNDIRISGDSKTVAAISNLNHINVMDIRTGKHLVENIIHPRANRLLFDSDAKRLVSYKYTFGHSSTSSGADEHTLKVWNLKDGSLISETLPYKNSFSTVCFSNDGKSLLITSPGSSARLLDADNLKKQIVSVAPSTYFPHGEISRDDKNIITIFENQIRVSDAQDGYLKYDPIEFPDGVFKVVLSPDGKFIAAFNLGEEKVKSQVRFYDIETGKEIFSPIFFNYKLYDAFISPCSRYITLSGDVIQKWDITTGKPASAPEPYSQLHFTTVFRPGSNEFVKVSGGRKLCLDKLVTFQEILDFYRNMW